MHCTRKVTENVIWVGGNDRRLALFENLFPVPNGVSYNSYLILDEKTALMDTADSSIDRQFTENLNHALAGRELDYLVIDHMEPDHCANILALCGRFSKMKLVCSQKAAGLLGQFYEADFSERLLVVAEGDTLSLGKHTLQFIMAPMVHWPEVMMSYEQSEKLLFSADAFGTFGALDGNLFADETPFESRYLEDARRYYANIVGKYGPQVQAMLKKAAALDIHMICPLHGPVIRENLGYFLQKYDLWSRYEPEEKAVAVFYASMYGNTESAAEALALRLSEKGVRNVVMYDVSKTHLSYLISEIFRCSHLVFAAPTYNNGLYPAMETLLADMKALNLQNRTAALIENGSWAPQAGKLMKEQLAALKNMRIEEAPLTLRSAMKEEQLEDLDSIAEVFSKECHQN